MFIYEINESSADIQGKLGEKPCLVLHVIWIALQRTVGAGSGSVSRPVE